jgi:H+-translocating NAD(P) transhydrogenase subunit alpha
VRIAVARDQAPGEARVAMVPDLVGRLRAAGYEVAVQAGAGVAALLADEAYEAAGAQVTEHAFDEADVVLSVQPLDAACLAPLPSGATTISFFPYAERPTDVALRRDRKLTTFGMEYVPRISRAQSMDALSSQALVTGYRGAVVAANMLGQFFPLSMTAAGTVPPAQVVVLGAGVAGLQAIATCRRLGAVVKGYDVRAAAAEEIRSMGAVAIELPLPTLEGAGGYAREMTEDRAQRQRELLAGYIAAADALITTAAVPGRRAPLLVTTEMITQMAPGSVVVDLAAEVGGNVEGVVAGKVVRVGSVQLWGGANVPSQMPEPASRLYAQNVLNVIMLMSHDGRFAPDFDDEITAAMCVTHAGQVLREH